MIALASISVADAHPSHVSIAQAEFNPKTKKLEIALRVHAVDLERAIQASNKKRVNLDKSKASAKVVAAYVAKTFLVTPAKGKQKEIEWVGMELQIKYAWLYFEVPLPEGIEGTKFSNRMFFEHLPNQANTINFKSAKKRTSIISTKAKPDHTASFVKKKMSNARKVER